jgi:F420H(2)-dependent quinone reductase
VLNQVMKGHVGVYRATRGRVGGKVPGLPSILLLEHVGARTDREFPIVILRRRA